MDANDGSLYRKLLWLTFFRLAIGTVLFASTAIRAWQLGNTGSEAVLYAVALGIYLASLGFALALRFRRALSVLAYAEIAVDIAIAGAVVALTGGSESVFVFLFLLGIVNGAVLKFRPGAVFAAILAVLVDVGAVTISISPTQAFPARELFVHTSAFFLTAALATYLSEQLRRAGERLEASQSDLAAITALHEELVQSVASGLLTLDDAGRVTFLNRAGEAMTGLSVTEVIGRPAENWLHVLKASDSRGETDFINARGERLRIGYTSSPLIDRGGRAIGQAVIFQDLTRLRQMEEAVQRSARLADLGRLAAGLAHELRNPLASMTGSIELLRSGASLSDEERKLMGIVLREATRLNQLVSSFLEFARPRAASNERLELAAVVGETLDVFVNDPAAQRAQIERSLSQAFVQCDSAMLKQVLWNLLVNAAQALDGVAEPKIAVSCAPESGGARIVVSDTGVGIPPSELGKIFIPFYTTKERGTGLGLATVHRIVESQGGSIDVESVEGRGTRFTVHLPSEPPRAAA